MYMYTVQIIHKVVCVVFFYCIKLYGGSTLFGADRNVWRLKHVLMCRSHLTQPCSASHISLHCTSDDLQPFSKMPMFFADFPRTVSSDMHTSTHKHTLYRFSFDNMFVKTHILHIWVCVLYARWYFEIIVLIFSKTCI